MISDMKIYQNMHSNKCKPISVHVVPVHLAMTEHLTIDSGGYLFIKRFDVVEKSNVVSFNRSAKGI